MNEFVGWLNVYKTTNISSFGVIKEIKKKFNVSKIGHSGTLDPLAEGILPLAIGKTTKLIPLIQNMSKCYEFKIKWGEQTTTDDSEGEILGRSAYIPKQKEIQKKLNDFKGNILQKPPKASAVKINGIRAYKRLRNNESFETKDKLVKIHNIKFINQSCENISEFMIECGSCFYVRSFARDLAESLNTRAHIYSLKRTKVGRFTIENSILLDDLLKISQMAFGIKGFHKSISMLDDILAFEIDNEKKLIDVSRGKAICVESQNLTNSFILNDKKIFLATRNNEVISIGYFDGKYFKPKKVLI